MASRLVLTGVTALFLALCLQPSTAFHQVLGSASLASGQAVTVPTSGVYLIAMVADPNGRVDMVLWINHVKTLFTAYGLEDAVAGLTVALPLRAKDRLDVKMDGHYDSNGASRLSVVLVTEGEGNFKTVRGIEKTAEGLKWHYSLDAHQRWIAQKPPIDYFMAGSDGMYWISARPDAGDDGLTGVVTKFVTPIDKEVLFRIYCQADDVAVSTSGAFYLSQDNWIFFTVDETDREVQSGSVLSLVELTDNDNMAYTGMVDRPGTYHEEDNIPFGYGMTDSGEMYDSASRSFTIRRSGLYIVSIRVDPEGDATTTVDLFRNDTLVFTAYSEDGLPSGQTTVLHLDHNDALKIRPSYDNTDIDVASMMSIAYISDS